MARGNITRREATSWRLKFDVGTDPVTGKRQTRTVTVRGKRQDAEKELTRLLNDRDNGNLVDPSKQTVAEYLRAWLDGGHEFSTATRQRYTDIIERQTIPVIGHHPLQKLRPAHVQAWLDGMRKSGGRNGRPLSARTCSHAFRVVRAALQVAANLELVNRNAATAAKTPKADAAEVEILTAEQITAVLEVLFGHALFPLIALALATGMRRGELCALQWRDVS